MPNPTAQDAKKYTYEDYLKLVPGVKDWQRAGVYDEGDILNSVLLPGFRLDLKNIFE